MILNWLHELAQGQLSPDEVLKKLADFPYQDLGFANIDSHRNLRNGNSEVIYCPGKSVDQIVQIFRALAEKSQNVIATRAGRRVFQAVQSQIPDAEYYQAARIVALWRNRKLTRGIIGVLAAGTADLNVAEEACTTAEIMGSKVIKIYDVGVAGIHRLFDKRELIEQCRVLIVVAGMEGALASVVGGLVDKPIVAVPTSIGYGSNFKGVAPLLSMLNSCASGIGVVNIDNGFGAGVLAHRINLLGEIK
ncbi:MAG TPA: nickel pincer cofactor biosynthesis protein LarB [Firmicutes bacterium]|nr:nickel pincer cofactor biosynthesis protein LarB [Bacillota bacterium]